MTVAVTVESACVDERLQNVDVHLPAGTCTHLMGENGAGKTTLLSAIAGLLDLQKGTIRLNDTAIGAYGLMELAAFRGFHQPQQASPFELTVAEIIRFYRPPSHRLHGIPESLEDSLEVSHLLPRKISQLSGGERQRALLCRALLQVWPAVKAGRALLLLDEPLTGLDIRHQYSFMILMGELTALGNTVVLSSHDIQISANYADKLCFLKQGRLVAQGSPAEVVTPDNLGATFNCQFEITQSENSVQIFVTKPTVRG